MTADSTNGETSARKHVYLLEAIVLFVDEDDLPAGRKAELILQVID